MKNSASLRKDKAFENPDELACLFQDLVHWPEEWRGKRERLYTPSTTFWMFLAQVFYTGASCQEMVARFIARLTTTNREASANNAAYCKARMRLPQEAINHVHQDLVKQASALAPRETRWGGRPVKVLDGSSVSMPDTPANQAQYPQPNTQKKGCGFPVMRLTVLFSLSTGAVLAYAKDALAVHERTLFHRLWHSLEKDDILLADRGFCGYADFHLLLQRGIDCVMRKHQRRGKSSSLEKKLGKKDALMRWRNTGKPKWLSMDEWRKLPETMVVREISIDITTPGFRTKHVTITTTLRDHKKFPPEYFAELYRRRWAAELYLRDIKTTMAMDVLRCESPAMIHKELTMYLIAYNLLRITMMQAARRAGETQRAISFKSSLATLRQWAPYFLKLHHRPRKRLKLHCALLDTTAKNRLPNRPDRVEPRARKRRPKNYPLLTKPRQDFEEIPHRNNYRATQS